MVGSLAGSAKADPLGWLQADGSRQTNECGIGECKRTLPSPGKEDCAQGSRSRGSFESTSLTSKQFGCAFSEVHQFAISDASSSCDGSCSPEEYITEELKWGEGNGRKVGSFKSGLNCQAAGNLTANSEQSHSKGSWMRWARERVSGASFAVSPVSVVGSVTGGNRMRGFVTSSGKKWGDEAEDAAALSKHISLDRDWEAVADGVRVAFWSHLETLSQ